MKYIIVFMLFAIFACKKVNRNISRLIVKDDEVFKNTLIKIIINDTLVLSKDNRGEIEFLNQLQDSIKKTKSDFRSLSIYVKFCKKRNKMFEKNEIIKDTFYDYSEKLNDTLISPFYIIPETKGNGYIIGVIDEEVFLEAYKYKDTSKTRALISRYYFEKEVYVIK